jgi:heme-degrading monooxygenase HmoA
MISRQWRGLARAERAADYEAHLRAETFPALRGMDGFVDATILRRDLPRGVEFLVVTRWRSLDAIAQFAGRDLDAAVVPEPVRAMMLEFDERVRHYEVVNP